MADGRRVNDEESLGSTDANDAARRPRRDLSKPGRTIARKRDATTASVETVSTQWIDIIDIPSYVSVTNVRCPGTIDLSGSNVSPRPSCSLDEPVEM